jgi:peptide/nickel transport system ATP-binding protein
MAAPLLQTEGISVGFRTRHGMVEAVRDISFSIAAGETLAIVGESGSGKSVTAYSILGILDQTGDISSGRILFDDRDLTNLTEREMRLVRGRDISIIFQDPLAALNPIRKVGHQLEDTFVEHTGCSRKEATNRAIEMLSTVRISHPYQRYHAYPFELSGGMAQRVMIAIAMICQPRLLIADEPTTGLDVTTQRVVMDMIAGLCRSNGMSVLLISHDLGMAAQYADRIVVMKDGLVEEHNDVVSLFSKPRRTYTKRLIRATPRLDSSLDDLLVKSDDEAMRILEEPIEALPARAVTPPPLKAASSQSTPLLEVTNLVKEYKIGREKSLINRFFNKTSKNNDQNARTIRAIDGISFLIQPGESLGIVGESGCGKTTTARAVARLVGVTSGSIKFNGKPIEDISPDKFVRSPFRRDIQFVFQDPTGSLNPRFTAFRLIADPLYRIEGMRNGRALNDKVTELAIKAGLPPELLTRFPHQLSGGQKARVGIARAIALDPKLLILDEPTTALDVSVQAIVLNQLAKLRDEMGLSYLFISHNLNVVRLICQRVLVMNAGIVVEEGNVEKVLCDPRDEYTRSLIDAIPHLEDTIPKTVLDSWS